MATMKDSPARSIAKAATWQVTGLVAMLAVGYLVTGSLALGGQIAVASVTLGFLSYVLHERIWARIQWGRGDAPADADKTG